MAEAGSSDGNGMAYFVYSKRMGGATEKKSGATATINWVTLREQSEEIPGGCRLVGQVVCVNGDTVFPRNTRAKLRFETFDFDAERSIGRVSDEEVVGWLLGTVRPRPGIGLLSLNGDNLFIYADNQDDAALVARTLGYVDDPNAEYPYGHWRKLLSTEQCMVKWETMPHPDHLTVHTRIKLTEEPFELYGSIASLQRYITNPSLGAKVAEKLFEVNGVVELCVLPYEIRLKKGNACVWKDMERDIGEALESVGFVP